MGPYPRGLFVDPAIIDMGGGASMGGHCSDCQDTSRLTGSPHTKYCSTCKLPADLRALCQLQQVTALPHHELGDSPSLATQSCLTLPTAPTATSSDPHAQRLVPFCRDECREAGVQQATARHQWPAALRWDADDICKHNTAQPQVSPNGVVGHCGYCSLVCKASRAYPGWAARHVL